MSRPPRRQSGIGLIKEPGDGVGAMLRYLSPNGFAVNGFDTLARTGGKGKASTGSARKGRGDERKALTGSARKGWGDVASIPQPDPSIPQDERGKRTNGGTGRTGNWGMASTGSPRTVANKSSLTNLHKHLSQTNSSRSPINTCATSYQFNSDSPTPDLLPHPGA